MKRIIVSLLLLVLMLTACDGEPVIIITTPTQEVLTETPTPIATSTPFVRQYLDCLGGYHDVGETPVNSNPCLLGQNVEITIPTADGRYQCVPDHYYPVVEPGRIGVPPYMNCQERQFGINSTPVILLEVNQIDGLHGLGFAHTFLPNECYVIKQSGRLSLLTPNPNGIQNVWLEGRVLGGGINVSLRQQSFGTLRGDYEIFWFVRTAQSNIPVNIELLTGIQWASYEGVNEIWSVDVLNVSDQSCVDAERSGALTEW